VPSASSFSRQAAQKAAAIAASRTGPLGSEFSLVSGELTLLRSSTGSAVPDSPVFQSGSAAAVSLSRTGFAATQLPARLNFLLLCHQVEDARHTVHANVPRAECSCRSQGRTASGNSALAGRIPGDCYVWGSAATEPTVALGIPTSAWQHSLSPVLVDDSTHLDVRSVCAHRTTYSMLGLLA
jgi:hypothetical protein